MKIFYTDQAVQDLADLRAWLRPRSRSGFRSVSRQLEAALEIVKAHPAAGRRTAHADIREVIEPKYGFVIAYLVDNDRLIVMTVRNGRRDRASE